MGKQLARLKRWAQTALGVGLASCAAGTGILPAGPDTFTVTEHYAPIRGGTATAQKVALTEANEFCEGRGQKFMPISMGTRPGMTEPNPTGYSVTFRCLQPGDPELHRPVLEPAPDVVIEQRNR
jgi:hypothetical protein